MDIRLKRYGRLLKAVAFILACVSFGGVFATVFVADRYSGFKGVYNFQDAIFAKSFTQSNNYRNVMFNVLNNLDNVQRLNEYIELYEVYSAQQDARNEAKIASKEAALREENENADTPTPELTPQFTTTPSYGEMYTGRDIPPPMDRSASETAPAHVPDEYYENLITNYYWNGWNGIRAVEENLKADLNYLNGVDGLVYYVKATNSDKVFTNMPGATPDWIHENFTHNETEFNYLRDGAAAAFRQSYISEMNEDFARFRSVMLSAITLIIVFAVLFLLSLAYIIFAAGRATADKTIRLVWLDRLFTEFILLLMFLAIFPAIGLHDVFYNYNRGDVFIYNSIMTGCVLALLASLELAFLLSLVRRLKDGTIISHSLLYAIFTRGFRAIAGLFRTAPMTKRVVAAVIGLGTAIYLAGAFFVFAFYGNSGFSAVLATIGLATVPVSVWLAVKALSKLTTVQEGLVNAEMSRRLRAERLRTELISNVSHDIRTPLTSVITYVELLRGEELENEKARGYIDVIASKSQRLKQLTDDLFEASKAASGNIPVAIERVDLNELVTQGLGEMDAKIRESGLDFRVTLPGEPEFVSADGRLLWRVVENLLSNVFKYAMAGSRVYVETSADESYASLSIKNISENALNIPAEDLLERFRRGDEARGGEGSGLGLAIAKSLTEAMGGRFELSVDGDLFKATVTLIKI